MSDTASGPGLGVAILQCEGWPGDPAANLERLEAACVECGQAGDGLLVAPELFLSGYHIGEDAHRLAVERDDPLLARVADIAARHRLALCVGYPERGPAGVYNSALLTGADRAVIGHYRKHRPSGEFEHATFQRGGGDDLVAVVAGIPVGVLICYDAEFPENVRRLARAGVKLVLVPTALSHDFGIVSEKLIPTRAFENGVFVAYADRCGVERGKRYAGLSCIVAPDGADLARAGGEEIVLRARVAPGDYGHLAERLPYLRDLERG